MPDDSGPPESPRAPAGDDWAVQVADRIESVVGTVRDKTTVPITKVARGVVFGVVAAVAGTVALVMAVVAIIRLHVYLPFHPEGRKLWTSYAVLGAIFVAVGGFTWRKRHQRRD